MHLTHIVDLINKVATEHPDARQELIDLATLGYRDGLIQGKIIEIANSGQLKPDQIDEGDITPEEMQEIIEDTENWFREVMSMTARRMVDSQDREEREAGKDYLQATGTSSEHLDKARPNITDIMQYFTARYGNNKSPSMQSNNRVQVAMEDLMEENPGLFD